MIKYPRRYQFSSDRQHRLALRRWRVANRQRIKDMTDKCPAF